MKPTILAALLFASSLAAGSAAAQPAPFNDIGVTMGRWPWRRRPRMSRPAKIFLAMGGKLFMPGGNP